MSVAWFDFVAVSLKHVYNFVNFKVRSSSRSTYSLYILPKKLKKVLSNSASRTASRTEYENKNSGCKYINWNYRTK
jgi:hypothetical protein